MYRSVIRKRPSKIKEMRRKIDEVLVEISKGNRVRVMYIVDGKTCNSFTALKRIFSKTRKSESVHVEIHPNYRGAEEDLAESY